MGIWLSVAKCSGCVDAKGRQNELTDECIRQTNSTAETYILRYIYIEKKTHFLNDVDLLSSSIILYYSMNTRVVCILEYYYYYVVLPRVERNFLIFFYLIY